MPSPLEWAEGYLGQARADLGAATKLATQSQITMADASVLVMLLQMALEKFAKAAALRSQVPYDKVGRSHAALKFLRHGLKLGCTKSDKLLLAFRAAEPDLQRVESLQPSIARFVSASVEDNQPQLEYPWVGTDGEIRFPARDLDLARDWAKPGNHALPKFMRFMSQLDRDFERVFR